MLHEKKVEFKKCKTQVEEFLHFFYLMKGTVLQILFLSFCFNFAIGK